MDTEYDRKFAEMKKYIPFLESMIERLETTSLTSEQPRRAQLDKIRSLRDLLLDKRKRMKMENLLKCEQVLVNLHAKMEQQTDIPKMNTEKPKEKADLDIVRNKLKSVVTKSLAEEDNQSDTFEIASRSETEELCTTLSKEPALFQRRENRAFSPPEKRVSEKPVPKRNYTRVLVSPEPSSRRWSEESQTEKPLFRRRSPRKSPKKTSPTYHKKERKKSSSSKKKSKGLNITLNVPEESLNSLNSEDILSRIINCNDNDVEIDTLRDLRKQILGELEQTGAGDITEAIMKSYKKKSKKSKAEKKTEVEEGELSDSESEAIKSIYGSLVLVDKDKNTSEEGKSLHEKGKKPRKIQICLVINKDKGDQEPGPSKNDVSEFELFDIEGNQENNAEKCIKEKDEITEKECVSRKSPDNKQNEDKTQSNSTAESRTNTEFTVTSSLDDKLNPKKTEEKPKSAVPFKPNFYKSIDHTEAETSHTEVENVENKSESVSVEEVGKNKTEVKEVDQKCEPKSLDVKGTDVKSDTDNKGMEKSKNEDKDRKKEEDEKDKRQEVKIPLLNEDPVVPLPPPAEPVVCQIDILQALRNDILSEDIGISGGEASTPLLHQPKVRKVANAQELAKKKITIEKYKEKSVASKKSLYYREPSTSSKEDAKKQSLKLTEKECERFNFPPKLALDDSSDEEESPAPAVLDDIYGDLVPKSPEKEDANNTEYAAPVIIPVEPVKTTIVDAKNDIDMRKLPLLSPTTPVNHPNVSSPTINLISPTTIDLLSPPKKSNETKIDNQPESVYRPPLVDPRLKWELNMPANSRSPNSQSINTDRNARPLNYPHMTPSMTPSRTPSMTPNARTYEVTPSHQSFEFDDNTSRKHVYAPLLPLPIHEPLDQRETSMSRDYQRQPHWEPNSDMSSPEGRRSSKWESSDQRDGHNSRKWGDRSSHREQTNEFHKSRYDSRRDRYGYSKRDDYSYNRSDCPRTPVHPFGRSDCPTTPNPSFGRNETPLTPVHPFGRSDCPLTPSHPFGRSEHPMTPNHPFGRSEAPMTPSHPFGRSEAPMTPSHSFGRSEAPMTPSHPFGRSDYSQNLGNMFNKDPRLNRSANFESTSRNFDSDRERSHLNDRRNTLDSSRNYRERSVGRSDVAYDRGGRGYNREEISQREPSVGRSMSRDFESNDMHSRDRRDNRRHARNENEGISRNEVCTNRVFQRDHSVGRGTPSVDRYRSSSRGPSNYTENTLSVEPQSGHSFTIDTSVNRTFQEFLNQKGIPPLMSSFDERRKRGSSVGRALLSDPTSFDARRQRASSVGRALLPDLLDSFDARKQRASSVGRGLLSDPFSFDSRRQRASSVGRNLISLGNPSRDVRESSIARTHSSSRNFTRAESIGKDIGNRHGYERTLKEIKADFQSYSANFKKTFATRPEKQMKYVDPRTRKERKQAALEQKLNKQSSNNSKPYSPRKNPRDPRFRRELQNESRQDKDRDRKKHGIVYSNDNIAKGTILGPGYGVKNYKIPKIKRPVEEKVEDVKNDETKKTEENKLTTNLEKKGKEKSKTSKDTTEKTKKPTSIKDNIKNNDEKEKLNARKEDKTKSSEVKKAKPSRSSRNISGASKFADYQEAVKSRKSKRAVISDSDSDDETKNSSKDKMNNIDKTPSKENTTKDTNETHKSSDMKSNKNQDDILDSSFGMDDIELPDNINALIADLDNDLQTGKNDKDGQFSKDLAFDNLFDNIDSPEDKEMTVEESLKDLSDLINADMDHHDEKDIVREIEKEIKLQSSEILKEKEHLTNDSSNQQPEKESNRNDGMSKTSSVVSVEPQQILHAEDASVSSVNECLSNETNEPQDSTAVEHPKPEDIKQYADNEKNENIVSTTEIGKDVIEKEAINEKEQEKTEQTTETSTPDSTIDSSETTTMKEHLPDSTNEIHNEMHSDVTSSHESTETLNQSASSSKEAATELSSVENILNLLQDKSKIKQLLSMLDTDKTSENEKLKKKLEKLSEIVSEDEESNDSPSKVPETSDDKNKSIEKKPIEPEEKANENISIDTKIAETNEHKNISMDSKIAETNEHENIFIDSKIAETNEQDDEEQTKTNFCDENLKPDDKVLSSSPIKPLKVPGKKIKRGKKKFISEKAKRMTRSGAAALKTSNTKPKASRELKQLQEDIKEMFIKDDVLNATGIRMCRLAKLVDDKNTNEEEDVEPRPIVVLEKFKPSEALNEKLSEAKLRKKPGPKPKSKATIEKGTDVENKDDLKKSPKCRPGPKSKTKTATRSNEDPYEFEGDSDSNTKNSDDGFPSSDSEDESLASSASIGSSEALAELKKKPKRKRGRGGWQSGVIKPKKRKKKVDTKVDSSLDENVKEPRQHITIPDMNSFTDKKYSFLKNVTVYSCRLCEYSGDDIVHHYKTRHPHSEVPLSRMDPETARDAIKESEGVNFQAISKVATDKYVCRFCYREFVSKRKDTLLETFFWHVVSTHTGEYKQLCSECINVTRCPFNLDIPPPPKEVHGQLVGYICEKCNFTQLSLENLKTHVIVRHNDEQTSVYVINLAIMSKKMIQNAIEHIEPRVLRSSRSNQSVNEQSDDRSDANESTDYLSETEMPKAKSVTESPALKSVPDVPKMRANLTFEDEDNVSDLSNVANTEGSIKKENSDDVDHDHVATENIPRDLPAQLLTHVEGQIHSNTIKSNNNMSKRKSHGATDEVVDLPHFKVSFTETGAKEYVCCINGTTNHYKTTLLISMKKHIQTQHKENWDGYCSICKVIVMPQGAHTFKDCFQHLLDNHFDNFPILERNEKLPTEQTSLPATLLPETVERPSTPYINVRPLSELMSVDKSPAPEESPALPVIESVVSLGVASVDATQVAPTETDNATPPRQPTPTPPRQPTPTPPRQPTPTRPPSVPPLAPVLQPVDYEKPQADVIAKKQQVVLDTMMSRDTLVHIFKCAGRYCCFSTDSAEHALLHASAHQRLGGENSLICAYCDFDCSGNSIDLVTHVFKVHGRCQFACSQCFYRAVASQLVSAHMSRVHGDAATQGVVLKTATVTPGTDAPTDQLTREVAVAYYTCVNAPATCKYKTYIENKFGEHLAKHEPPFMCNICPVGFPIATALLEHLKCHDMMLYQCTWCVFGANDEPSLLAHASARHPTKVPQAYLRVVTTREAPDGTLKMMVLPLAQFNSSVVQTELVTPSNKKDNPVKEAERAMELEKLIGSMSAFSTSNSFAETSESVSSEAGVTDESMQADIDKQLLPEPPRTVTPAPTIRDDLSIQTTPVLKTEPVDEQAQPAISEVINLDSDEEDSRDAGPSVIDISDDDRRPPVQKSQPPDDLYKCSKQDCTYSCKRKDLFRKHIQFGCFKTGGPIKCAHCPAKLYTVNAVMRHYEEEHGRNNECGTCGARDASLDKIKRHFRREHGSKDLIVASTRGHDARILYVVKESPVQLQKTTPQKVGPSVQRQKPGPKRKLSAGNLAESPAKKKRYSPQDVDQLPSKPILDELVYCALCEFNTKVRLNLVRHLQLHAEKQPVAQSVPVNPVPHLETNEKYFDRMVNLASSSIVRAPDKPARADPEPSVNLLIPPEAASRYPKYVPERQRLTCGARGCSYTSLDEGMLKCHWETLHTGTNDYHCVHCPPYQHVDTSKPLTAARIISHLKMHDICLYACPSCAYYHYKRQAIEKHLNEAHQGVGQVMVVREEGTQPSTASQPPPSSGPTMDLKPWQCGLCKFKSMLRQEVVEHCAQLHNSKMQFKCPNCPFRTSTIDNVTKHQSKSHPGSTEEVIYFYYREGSIPDEADGTPRWLKQRQRTGTVDPEVKEEVPDKSLPVTPTAPVLQSYLAPSVDLDIVKKEPDENTEMSIEDLRKKYGEFCEPNGLKYKCPLCKIVDDDSKESMQSHLFEELQYRKWGCGMCTYKAFHKTGLNEHMLTEHRQHRDPTELPLNRHVETWVAQLLQHQTDLIQKAKENFAKQKIQVAKPRMAPSTSKVLEKPVESASKSRDELEQAFGPLGAAKDSNYCCPKCPFKTRDHSKMQDHLESELNKIRWRCSICGNNFQEYHEAQLHCRTVHGVGARPVEALRDPAVRAAWVAAALRVQREALSDVHDSPVKPTLTAVPFVPAADPLLEVRYERNVPTPEEEMLARRKRPLPSPARDSDDDDERLVIDEEDELAPKKKSDANKLCPYCDFSTRYVCSLSDHILRHYNLKPYTCGYCDYNCHITQCKPHNETFHPHLRHNFFKTKLPAGPPTKFNLPKKGKRILSSDSDQSKPKEDKPKEKPKEDPKAKDETPKVQFVCLVCDKLILESDCPSHTHENIPVNFGKKGEIVVKCCNCWILLPNVETLQAHHSAKHPTTVLNYAYYKLGHNTREILACDHCDKRFKFLNDMKRHHNSVHGNFPLKYSTKPYTPDDVHTIELEDDKEMTVETVTKRVAKKSTTKLPPTRSVAKKSTTKLPLIYLYFSSSDFSSDSESEEEYSYYGNKPQSLGDYPNVTTVMPFCNKLTKFSVKQLSEIIKVDPKVIVEDINKNKK